MNPDVLVLPSPLLGGAAYLPLADALTVAGAPAVVADLPGGLLTPAAVVERFAEQVRAAHPGTLVAHSNAGYLVPVIRASAPVSSVVFVDAALPAGKERATTLAPAQFAEFVATLPREHGLLPPWPTWWDSDDIAPLFPSADWLARVTDEAPRLPPSWFTTPVEVPVGWESLPAAYLGFGGTYAAELTFAGGAGWPLDVVEGHHLQLLADPSGTAAAVLALRARVGRQGR